MELQKKVAAVTGGSSGIGLEAARLLRGKGCAVTVLARSRRCLDADIAFLRCDVRNEKEVEQAFEAMVSKHGAIDIVVNSAGVFEYKPFEEMTLEEAACIMDTNYAGIMNVCKSVLPYMIKQGRGHIVNVASTSAYMEIPNTAVYSASKAAVRSFSNALRMEVKRHGIRVSVVSPGYTRTGLFKEKFKKTPIFYRFPQTHPKAQAKAILRAIERNRREIIVGTSENVVIKLIQIFPWLGYRLAEDLERLDRR